MSTIRDPLFLSVSFFPSFPSLFLFVLFSFFFFSSLLNRPRNIFEAGVKRAKAWTRERERRNHDEERKRRSLSATVACSQRHLRTAAHAFYCIFTTLLKVKQGLFLFFVSYSAFFPFMERFTFVSPSDSFPSLSPSNPSSKAKFSSTFSISYFFFFLLFYFFFFFKFRVQKI